jgi:hypothetical protein
MREARLIAAVMLLTMLPAPALSADGVGLNLTMESGTTAEKGYAIPVFGQLTAAGNAVPSQNISLLVDGVAKAYGATSTGGWYSTSVKFTTLGTHSLQAAHARGTALETKSGGREITVVPPPPPIFTMVVFAVADAYHANGPSSYFSANVTLDGDVRRYGSGLSGAPITGNVTMRFNDDCQLQHCDPAIYPRNQTRNYSISTDSKGHYRITVGTFYRDHGYVACPPVDFEVRARHESDGNVVTTSIAETRGLCP